MKPTKTAQQWSILKLIHIHHESGGGSGPLCLLAIGGGGGLGTIASFLGFQSAKSPLVWWNT